MLRHIRFSQRFLNPGTGYNMGTNVLRLQASLFVGSKIPCRFVSISNYIREKVSGPGFEGTRYKFDMDMGSRISPPISFPRLFFTAHASDTLGFSNTFTGDRTASDLSLALISRLPDV